MSGTLPHKISQLFSASSAKGAPNCSRHLLFKRADRGLYAGESIRFGTYRTEMKNRIKRTWLPNTHKVLLFSETLGKKLKLRVSAKALQTIDRVGGLDNYILEQPQLESTKAARIKAMLLQKKLEVEIGEIKEPVYCLPA